MRQVMVRYKVKPDQVERNEALVRAVYDELRASAPAGFRYSTFKLDDGVSFVHIALGSSPLSELGAFREFQDGIAERCDEPPVVTEVILVGSYGGGDAP
jgi:hypothetical protein